ncbi:universal stress protein [Streptomyces sp. NPDC018029]|uniref:universal stress protein n=1 Tax=Streptomyces sp. NPDC018029 TaxID=3365032 RepID=UPI0037B03854
MGQHPLVVGVDGSQDSSRAVDWALDEAVRRGGGLRIVHASSWEWYEGHEPSMGISGDSVQAYAERIVTQAVEHASRRTVAAKVTCVEVISQVPPEDPAAALIRESHRASAVVVGTRGPGSLAGLLLGSVSLSVAAHAAAPVIVVRGSGESHGSRFGRVAVGVDLAERSTAALDFAFRAAELRGAALRAVHAWRCPAHEVPDHSRGDDVVEGSARTALLAAASDADLLVVGARRRKGHVGMQLGPVNHAVLHHCASPVAIAGTGPPTGLPPQLASDRGRSAPAPGPCATSHDARSVRHSRGNRQPLALLGATTARHHHAQRGIQTSRS